MSFPRIDSHVGRYGSLVRNGAGTQYVVQTPGNVVYVVYAESNSGDIYFSKSLDGGVSFGPSVLVVGTINVLQLSLWYEKWSGLSGGKIHVAYTDSTVSDVMHVSIDTENNDSVSTPTLIFAGDTAVATGGALSICSARSGYVYVLLCIDAGVESEFALSTDSGATWDLTRSATGAYESASSDFWILAPSFSADTNDLLCIFWDASANEISRKNYDHSADTWSETSIATSMAETGSGTVYPLFAVAVDLTNSRLLLAAWSAYNAANADLRVWQVDDTTITELTNVVLNSTNNQGCCAIAISTQDPNHIWVAYSGKTDGSETATVWNTYCKISKDGGTTWGAETALTNDPRSGGWLDGTPRFYYDSPLFMRVDSGVGYEIYVNVGWPRFGSSAHAGV